MLDKDEKKLAALEGFERGVSVMHELLTGKKPSASVRRPGRPAGSRNRRADRHATGPAIVPGRSKKAA